MDEEIIDGAGGAEDLGKPGAPGSDPNEPGLSGSETGAETSSPPSSGEPPAGEPASMEDAIRTGLALLEKNGGQPKPGEKKPAVPGQAGEGDPNLKGKPGAKPGQQEDLHRMPEGLSEQAQQRFSRLVNDNKDLSKKLEQTTSAAQELNEVVTGFRQLFAESQVTAPELDRFAGYIKAIKTGDFASAEQALVQQIQLFEQMTGRQINAGDPLADFPDLRQAVDAMQITEEHARELAASRRLHSNMQKGTQRNAQVNAERQANEEHLRAWEGSRDKALADIKAFSEKMQAEDIDWPAKQAIILKKVQRIVSDNAGNPERWLAMIQDAYETIAEAASLGAPKGGRREPAPLTSGGKGGAGKAQPGGDMLSAIRSGLNYG